MGSKPGPRSLPVCQSSVTSSVRHSVRLPSTSAMNAPPPRGSSCALLVGVLDRVTQHQHARAAGQGGEGAQLAGVAAHLRIVVFVVAEKICGGRVDHDSVDLAAWRVLAALASHSARMASMLNVPGITLMRSREQSRPDLWSLAIMRLRKSSGFSPAK